MPKINVLPKQLAELIAAGEVVEKPASVIKELTENAIDAGATKLTVEIKNGGVLYMRVTDNGCGIKKDDVKTAFLRHATSKIVNENDLNSIATLGFRGEALAAICAVSKVEMVTRTEDDIEGTRYCIEGGEEKVFEEAGCDVGTTIIVKDLFYNTPARMKFLHKDTFEGNLINDVLEKIALSHPEIAIKFIRDNKTVFTTSGDNKLFSVIYSVLGREFASGLIETNAAMSNISVNGYVCKPIYCKPKRNSQYFFLNGRTVRSATMVAALEAAYKNSAMVGKFPSCVLHIELPLESVDVNVHPSKTEVRFANEKPLFEAVYVAVKNALQKGDTRPQFTEKKQLKFSTFERMTADEFKQTVIADPETKRDIKPQTATKQEPLKQEVFKPEVKKTEPVINSNAKVTEEKPVFKMALNDYSPQREEQKKRVSVDIFVDEPVVQKNRALEEIIDETQETQTKEPQTALFEELRYVGEIFKTYIIVEQENSVFFIDKHAAHERILFEKLKSSISPESQGLLLPVTVRLSAQQYNAVLDNIDALTKSGFDVEDFGNLNVIVRAVPSSLTGEDVSDVIIEVADNLANGLDTNVEKLDHIYHTVACKAAIKAGFNTPPKEQLFLAKQVLSNNDIRYCPHGRPVAFEMKKRDFEKQFGRIQ